jgi:transcriptional regulator with XRE-family HTH domain
VVNEEAIKKFGLRLRELRDERSISQQHLADIANVSKLTIQRIERAKYSVTLDTLVSISKALEIPLRELLDFEI